MQECARVLEPYSSRESCEKSGSGVRPTWKSRTHECHMSGGYGQREFVFLLLARG